MPKCPKQFRPKHDPRPWDEWMDGEVHVVREGEYPFKQHQNLQDLRGRGATVRVLEFSDDIEFQFPEQVTGPTRARD